MQTQSEKILMKNGRPPGSLGKTALMRNAIRVLQEIMEDKSAAPMAAIKLIDEADFT